MYFYTVELQFTGVQNSNIPAFLLLTVFYYMYNSGPKIAANSSIPAFLLLTEQCRYIGVRLYYHIFKKLRSEIQKKNTSTANLEVKKTQKSVEKKSLLI